MIFSLWIWYIFSIYLALLKYLSVKVYDFSPWKSYSLLWKLYNFQAGDISQCPLWIWLSRAMVMEASFRRRDSEIKEKFPKEHFESTESSSIKDLQFSIPHQYIKLIWILRQGLMIGNFCFLFFLFLNRVFTVVILIQLHCCILHVRNLDHLCS